MGKDTHALSAPAQRTALEVLAAIELRPSFSATTASRRRPVISRAILVYNRGRKEHLADGIVITPSHNPPEDGGFKYNPTNGGPADTDVTQWVQDRANELLRGGNAGVQARAVRRGHQGGDHAPGRLCPTLCQRPAERHRHGRHPRRRPQAGRGPTGRRGGALLGADQRHLRCAGHVVNPTVDPTFSFMTVDHDGEIRMDCSSPYAMARLVGLKDQYHVAFANDPDSDRHGIVTPSAGLMNPNHYLAVAIRYLLTHRPYWPAHAAVGKTLVSSSMIDRVVQDLGHRFCEVPVGFKWFVPGLFDGSCCFGGEESAGASFLRLDGTVWTTDKDGPIMDLLAAEITARHGQGSGRALPGTDGGIRHAVLHPHRHAGHARAEGAGYRSCRPRPSRSRNWRASRSRPS